MKNNLKKALVAMLALGVVSQADAYIYTFSNHTKNNVAVALKYKGAPSLKYILVKPNERQEFKPGMNAIAGVRSSIHSLKAGFIASQWLYLINPSTVITENNIANMPWKAFSFTYLKSDAYDLALEAAEAIGNMAETLGKTAAKAGVAYATGGVSLVGDEAKEVVEKVAKKAAKSDAVSKMAEADYSLGTFLSKVGNAIGHSAARSFHTDIIEDEDGKISFIVML